MIYSIFMRKIQGESVPFPTTIVVQEYIDKFVKDNDIVITFPGYMSNKNKTIHNFISAINFPQNTHFTVGMNGARIVKTTGVTIQEEHNKNFTLKVSGLVPSQRDHAKMMFFFDNDQPLTNINVTQLLTMNVKAVLLGSSNQSQNTYFNLTADKGEADIFLFEGRYIAHDEQINEENIENRVKNFHQNIIRGETRFWEPFRTINADYNIEKLNDEIILMKDLGVHRDLLNKIFKESIKLD